MQLGYVGSSQHTGIVVVVKFDMTNSPVDCDTMCIPIIFLTRRSAVDFPQDGAPMPVGTGHDSKANKSK